MEKMPYQPDLDRAMTIASTGSAVTSDWREALPVMTGSRVTLRELEMSDAASLFAMLTPEEVSRFISPPPTTVEGFELFITWARAEREAGRYACFAVVPHGMTTAIGLFQVRQLEPGFATAEWGFALGSEYWGTGMFMDGARMVVDFAVETLGVRRLEARACGGQWPRQRRAAQARRPAGRRAPQVIPQERRASGSDAVVDPQRGMASGKSCVGKRSFTSPPSRA